MEQQCKIGGESLRNRNVVNEDRISKLPEDLLLQILSSVPTKNVIAASVLSKRWRSLWKLVPKLDFDSKDHHTFAEDIYRSLILHKAPFLESLHMKIEDISDLSGIGVWIVNIAFERRVRELEFDVYNEENELFRFPSVVCSYNNTLKVLKLKYHILLDFPSRVCFNALRELDLEYVEFKDEASVCNFLCGCSSLEDLVVRRRNNMDVETFKIAVPSLQRLTIEHDDEGEGDGGYVINAPSLKYLNIKWLIDLEFFLIENAPELVEAKIIDVSDITNENILASLTSAKRLSLHLPVEIKCPTDSIFYRLLSLELLIDDINWWNLLSFMLHSSPKLQILKLISLYHGDCAVGWEWNQPKCVPECLLFHFETFVWKTYEWQREAEKQVATYILKNARLLKNATFSTTPIKPEELEKLEKRREMLNELASVVRSSNSCHLVFK